VCKRGRTCGNAQHPLTPTSHHGPCCFSMPWPNDSDGKPNTPLPNSRRPDHHLATSSELTIKPRERGDLAMEIRPRLWTVQDVADYLGVPVRTLYDWRCRDYGPRARKVGRYLRYEPAEVRHWLESLDNRAA
jgi:predicted DNA-binding transcriptional regulator AlpA